MKVTGGFAGGTTDCDLDYYECGGLNITVAMYEAVLHDAGIGRIQDCAHGSALLCDTIQEETRVPKITGLKAGDISCPWT